MPQPVRNALDECRNISARLARRRTAVFLDFDGTLSPIAADPEQARLDPRMRAALLRLSRTCMTTIISGRACADVRQRVGIDGIRYAGNHGLEVDGPDGPALRRHLGELDSVEIHRYAEAIRTNLAPIQGVLIEDKGFSLSVHYRQVHPAEVPEVEAAVDRLLEQFSHLRKRHGKKVFEVRPGVDWDKGKAVGWLLDRLGAQPTTAIYIGDDETDEDAFRWLRGRGIGIRVGRPSDEAAASTAAEYYLEDTDEVRLFLEAIAEAVASE